MIKLKIKTGNEIITAIGERDNIIFSLGGKTIGQGKIGNDGKAICTKGVEVVYASRVSSFSSDKIKKVVKDMVVSLYYSVTEEREWTTGKPVDVSVEKVWAVDGELKISTKSGREFNENEFIDYLKSFLPKNLFSTQEQMEPIPHEDEEFEDDDILLESLEVPTKPTPTEPDGGNLNFVAPTSLLDSIKRKKDE